MQAAIGIDFGTTNTRIAYFDGRHVRLLSEPNVVSPFIPSAIAYREGKPIAYGWRAKENYINIAITSLKWLLAEDKTMDVGTGHKGKTPIEIVSDYVTYLRNILIENRINIEEHKIALTLPVNYPLKARRSLLEAFRQGGLPIAKLYPEPVAALYAIASSRQYEGVGAIFDWGGGTLDLASVRVKNGKAFVLSTASLKEGGDDFDTWIAQEALNDFLKQHPELSRDREHIWQEKGLALRRRAEERKKNYFENPILRFDGFVGRHDLEYRLDASRFEERLRQPVRKALNLFAQIVQESGEPLRLIEPIILSGGTRHLPFIRAAFQNEFGSRLQDELPQTQFFADLTKDRIDSATAIGAALLLGTDSKPVCSRALGIRVADNRPSATADLFWPVFQAGEKIEPNKKITMEFFVTNPSSGVARLLICDQLEPEIESAGRLLKYFPVPIDRRESRIFVTFRLTEELLLEVSVHGAMANVHPDHSKVYVSDLALGYDLPQLN